MTLAVGVFTAASDPLVGEQPQLERLGVTEAWSTATGRGVVVAVLDTGVDVDHVDLSGQLLPGFDVVDGDEDPDDPHGHGTMVAGIIAAAADNGLGIAGAAPDVQILPIRVLDAAGKGVVPDVVTGIQWAIDHGADVINLSLAEVRHREDQSVLADSLVQRAIDQAIDGGIVVVAAAGNGGLNTTFYPADARQIIVGATDPNDVPWSGTNLDDRTLFAPGTEILSTLSDDRYATASGTSFAAGYVSAAAALLLSAGVPPDAVSERLARSAVPIGFGVGRVSFSDAVDGAVAVSNASPTLPSVRPTATPEHPDGLEDVVVVAAPSTATTEAAPTTLVTIPETPPEADPPPPGPSTEPVASDNLSVTATPEPDSDLPSVPAPRTAAGVALLISALLLMAWGIFGRR